ncbi:MAG: DUF3644 domain-containing protein [Caldilineaceae bacterium]|nr:DUF3644 domain-containing protein [Caldilineaceae bacterium]
MNEPDFQFELKDRLVEKSIEANVLALETINRLTIQYRLETFCFLFCNAWELLLKAKLIEQGGDDESIYHNPRKGKRKRSISLQDCLKKVFPSSKHPIRRNIERIEELRNECVHLVIDTIPADLSRLFQAGVINYHQKLSAWFGESLSDRYPVGMMSIVYDGSPRQSGIESIRLQQQLGSDAASFLVEFCLEIQDESSQLEGAPQFMLPVEYRLVLTKRHDEADFAISYESAGGKSTLPINVPRDPSVTHPFRQKELIEQLNQRLGKKVNQYDIQCINIVYKVKANRDFFFQGKVKGSPGQYSQSYVDWITSRFRQESGFVESTRKKRRELDLS